MDYTKDYLRNVVEKYGEVFIVLDSDREYELHGTDALEFVKAPNPSAVSEEYTVVRVTGTRNGEKLLIEFPLDKIEHHYTHREV